MNRMWVALLLAACGSASTGSMAIPARSGAARSQGFPQPPGTVAVNFSVDDTANRVYAAGDLKWKGSFLYEETARTLVFDPWWTGGVDLAGWPTLHDDGPWTAGGHEPIGAHANDHVWGVTVFVTPPPAGATYYEYGLIDVGYERQLGNGWIWNGPNGFLPIPAGATAPVTAMGMSLPRFGTVDLQLLLDTANLAPSPFPGGLWNTSMVTVKSSVWGWSELSMRDAGSGVWALELSGVVGPDNLLPRTGLLNPGDVAQFVFVLGGVEYRDYLGSYEVLSTGVTAGTMDRNERGYAPAPIDLLANGNTAITVPGCVGQSCTPGNPATPQPHAHGRAPETWLRDYFAWYLTGVAPQRNPGNAVFFMPLPGPADCDPTGTVCSMDVTLPAGTAFYLPIAAWISERYLPETGLPDDTPFTREAFFSLVQMSAAVDGEGVDLASHYAEAPYDPPLAYAQPTVYGSIAALHVQGVGFLQGPLPVGTHTVDIDNRWFGGAIQYHNHWNLTVAPR